jgi:hypothetical protein
MSPCNDKSLVCQNDPGGGKLRVEWKTIGSVAVEVEWPGFPTCFFVKECDWDSNSVSSSNPKALQHELGTLGVGWQLCFF